MAVITTPNDPLANAIVPASGLRMLTNAEQTQNAMVALADTSSQPVPANFRTASPTSTVSAPAAIANPAQDMRLILSPLNKNDFFQSGVMNVLSAGVGGILFPYTPTVAFSQSVNYMDLQLVHSNTDYAAYTRTPSVTISITGKFTVQSQTEGIYALACLHFLRVASKSYFGAIDQASGKAGLPPPILVLNGYGNYMFNQLRVVLKSHSYTFDDTADGINVIIPASGIGTGRVGQGYARLPALFSVSCELMVVQTPQRMRNTFSFDAFASGALMQPGTAGWI